MRAGTSSSSNKTYSSAKQRSPGSFVDIKIWSQVLSNLQVTETKNHRIVKIFNYNGIMMETVHSSTCSLVKCNSHWIDIYYSDRRINTNFFGKLKPINVSKKGKIDLYVRLYDYQDGSRLIYKFDACGIFKSNLSVMKKLSKTIYTLDENLDIGEYWNRRKPVQETKNEPKP